VWEELAQRSTIGNRELAVGGDLIAAKDGLEIVRANEVLRMIGWILG